jgi:Electron transfer DM13
MYTMKYFQQEKISTANTRTKRRIVAASQIGDRKQELSILFVGFMTIALFGTFSQAQTADAQEQVPSLSGQFMGTGDGIHNAEGIAREISIEDGKQFIRLENFKVTNGPDLYVYLATDKSASDFVNLGKLKANNGNQNYEIPEGTDLTKYDTALIWCKSFSVLFGSADLKVDKV